MTGLAALERRVALLRVPVAFAHLVYTLRQDMNLVRARLEAALTTREESTYRALLRPEAH